MIRNALPHQPQACPSSRRRAGAPLHRPFLSSSSLSLLARASTNSSSTSTNSSSSHNDHRIDPPVATTTSPASTAKPPTAALAAAAAALSVAAAVLLGAAAAAPPPARAALPFSTPAADHGRNMSVVRALRERTKRERLFGAADADPRPLLAGRLAAARSEAARIPTLVQIGQPDSARTLLREKGLANLRRDLAYLTGAYAEAVPERDVRGVVEAVERLDGGLRRAGPRGGGAEERGAAAKEVGALVRELDARLERVQRAVTALEGEAR